nr:peptide deformylase [Gammaproteobacteria bacterium]
NAKAYPLTVYINPRYQPVDENDRVADFEACYSVDAVSGSVPRYRKIKFNARTINGEPIELIAEDFLARVLQHETDHVHGLTIVDRLTPDCIQGSIDEMRERRYQQFSSVQKRIVDELKKE